MTVFGGKSGYLANTRNLCTDKAVIRVAFEGQNGKSTTQAVTVNTACGKGGRKRHRRGR